MAGQDDATPRFASPPCMASEVEAGCFDPPAVDPQQARDVARWRLAERARLRAERSAMRVGDRQSAGKALCAGLRRLLAERLGSAQGRVLSAYWPIKGEPDLRPLMAELHDQGVIVALPVVEVKAAPLAFRRWTPDSRMERGDWNIPVPPREAGTLTPDITLAPLVGWDAAGYRLGYGGGYFDRTLGAFSPRPFTIGIGLSTARLATIYPQPHDIPLDVILVETGIAVDRESR